MEYSLGYGTSPLAAQGVPLDLWDIVETGEGTATPKTSIYWNQLCVGYTKLFIEHSSYH